MATKKGNDVIEENQEFLIPKEILKLYVKFGDRISLNINEPISDE